MSIAFDPAARRHYRLKADLSSDTHAPRFTFRYLTRRQKAQIRAAVAAAEQARDDGSAMIAAVRDGLLAAGIRWENLRDERGELIPCPANLHELGAAALEALDGGVTDSELFELHHASLSDMDMADLGKSESRPSTGPERSAEGSTTPAADGSAAGETQTA